ncbi:MAG TPA: protein translocase subunit SecF [Kofleriaceae bacterium]|jgi:preprotein translocase subunit SecF|nr:protein translocase subunit SecF [Kofleriaceae bacterium]
MTDHHKFRYLLPPGNNFAFVAKFKIWLIISVLLMTVSIGSLFVNKAVRGEYMNWTIDFRGGTQVQLAFIDKQTRAPTKVDPGKIRDLLGKAGEEGFDVSEIDWNEANAKTGQDEHIEGILIRTPRFSAIKPETEAKAADDFQKKFADRQIVKASWSSDTLRVRTKKLISNAEAKPVFAADGLELLPWAEQETERYTTADESSGDFTEEFSMQGIAEQFQQVFATAMPDKDVVVAQKYGVGAKAGDKLRDDAAKSIIYSIFLIMLYLAFRFDIRYAPGAAFATIHDAVMVIGVFSLAWTDVSLTSVAGLLTVMGYSTNDTVIVFDRIRENQAKLKDKKIERIIDISINEMLVRTILTSSTVFATTLIMNIFGTGEVRNFAFAMNIGVIVGTYSSIFLAAPIFMWISRKWYSGPAPARSRPAAVSALPSPDDPPTAEE